MNTIRKSNDSGSTAIEFAIIFPIYLSLIMLLIEVGFVLWGICALNYGTFYGARYAFVNTSATSSEIEDYTRNSIGVAVDAIQYSVTVTPNVEASIDGTFTYQFIFLPMDPVVVKTQLVQPYPDTGT